MSAGSLLYKRGVGFLAYISAWVYCEPRRADYMSKVTSPRLPFFSKIIFLSNHLIRIKEYEEEKRRQSKHSGR